MRTIATSILLLTTALTLQAATSGDDFNDNIKNTSKWGADQIIGHGFLTETGGRLQYSCLGVTADDDFIRQWILSAMPYNSDWEMQMDVANSTTLLTSAQNSFGIKIRSPFTSDNEVFAELYASRFGGSPQIKGFHGELETGASVSMADTSDLGVTAGAVRMTFTSSNKVITLYYDLNSSDGYQWVKFGSFGVAGAGGDDGNADWGMTGADTFPVFVYGFSDGMDVTNGQLTGDNFSVTGGVGRFDALIAELQIRSIALTGNTNKTQIAQKKAIDKVLGTLSNASPISLATDLKNAGVAAKGLEKVFPDEFSPPVITPHRPFTPLGTLLQQIFDRFNGDIAAMEQAAQNALNAMAASSCKDKAQTALDKASADLAATGGTDFVAVFKAVSKAVTDTLKGQSAVVAALSCKSSGGGGGGGGGATGIQATINGTPWTANNLASALHLTNGQNFLGILGTRTDNSQVSMSINLGATATGLHGMAGYFLAANQAYYSMTTGQINITKLDDSTHKLTATFSFTAHNQTNASDVITATSGTVSIIDVATQ
jgi:hypothetical protein